MDLLFKIDKECKHSRRYAAKVDSKSPIKTIYVVRSYSNGIDEITITLPDLSLSIRKEDLT